jgi:signal transduction histidine kinase
VVNKEEASKPAHAPGLRLHTKVLMALAIASALPLTATFLLDGRLSASEEELRVFLAFISQPIPVFGYPLHFYALFVGAIFGASLAAAGIYMELVFVRPIHQLRRWVEAGKNERFEKMPVMPKLHSKDVSELGNAIAASLAFSYQTRSENRSLSSKKDELVVIAAHQLRTPLTGLKWAIQNLSSANMPDEKTERTVSEIQSTIQRIGLIVDNIVASADIEEGRFGYSFSSMDIVDVIQKALVDLGPTIYKRGVVVTFNPPTGLKNVSIDAYRMTTALYNIIENAIEYTPQGGTIAITLTDKGNVLELTVKDSGIGIPQNQTQHLFTKFFRADNAKHMRPDGSGLGLYLAKHVVEAHGQKLWLDSREGQGTTVVIPLPYETPRV